MNELAAIHDACADMIGALYKVLFESLLDAQGDAAKIAAAEGRFKAGIAHMRNARDRAIALLA